MYGFMSADVLCCSIECGHDSVVSEKNDRLCNECGHVTLCVASLMNVDVMCCQYNECGRYVWPV